MSELIYPERPTTTAKSPCETGRFSTSPAIVKTAPSQTAKADAGKLRLSLVPMQIVWDIAKVREWAISHKYRDPSNWKQVSEERYREALIRHTLRFADDPDGVDEETGLPHLYHIATNCAFLCKQLHDRQGMTVDEFNDWMEASHEEST